MIYVSSVKARGRASCKAQRRQDPFAGWREPQSATYLITAGLQADAARAEANGSSRAWADSATLWSRRADRLGGPLFAQKRITTQFPAVRMETVCGEKNNNTISGCPNGDRFNTEEREQQADAPPEANKFCATLFQSEFST